MTTSQRLQRAVETRAPTPTIPQLRRQLITACVPEETVLGVIDLGGVIEHGLHLGLDLGSGAVRLQRRVRSDLGAIDRHHAHLRQANLSAEHQHVGEQLDSDVLMTLTEPGDRGVIRGVFRRQHPERDIDHAEPLDLA